MATPESKTKTAIKRILAEHGVYYFMPPANGYGRAGIPDFVCCVNGRFLAIEAKAGQGKTTALQERELVSIENAGGVALVIYDNENDLCRLTNVLLALKELT